LEYNRSRICRIADATNDKDAIDRQAEMRADLTYPFPVRKIIRLTKEQGELMPLCELPDQAQVVSIPLDYMKILQPEMVMRFLAHREAVLNARSSGGIQIPIQASEFPQEMSECQKEDRLAL
jgi:hypothetical protein